MSFAKKFILSFVIFAAVCYVGLMWFVNSEVEKGFNDAVADIQGLTVDYSDLNVDLLDQRVCLDNVDTTFPQGQHVAAEQVCISSFDQLNPVPHFMSLHARGVTMEAVPASVGDWAPTLHALDMGVIKGDVDLDYAYDPDADAFTVNRLNISLPGAGDIKLSGTMDSLELEQFRAEKLIGLRVQDLTITFANRSFMDALMRESGKWLGVSKSAAQERICAELAAMANYADKDDNTVAGDALRGLNRYVDDPGTLTITASPEQPVPVLYFFMGRDIYDNIRLMNVKVETASNK